MRFFQVLFLTIFLFLILPVSGLMAQQDTLQSAPGLGEPGPADLPGYEARIRELVAAGYSESEIRDILVAELDSVEQAKMTGKALNPDFAEQELSADEVKVTPRLKGLDDKSNGSEAPLKETRPPDLVNQKPDKKGVRKSPVLDLTNPDLPADSINKVFGHQVFEGDGSEYFQARSELPSENYVIGPGDVINVTIWGASELAESLTVGEDGSVSRQYLGKVFLNGLTFGRVRELLRRKYRQIVSANSNIEIQLSPRQRSITINIVGEVKRPGAYQIPSNSSAFQALFSAGGITNIGSVRNILIRRGGETVQTLDLYDFLIEGNDQPVFLQNNDFLFVPVQRRVVYIAGKVQRPMGYELAEEENLTKLLAFAGGFTFDAETEFATISRLGPSGREVQKVDLSQVLASGTDVELANADRVEVFSRRTNVAGVVQIFGTVQYPATYPFQEGDKVSSLIERAGGVLPETYMDQAYIVRLKPETGVVTYLPFDLEEALAGGAADLSLQVFDAVQIFSQRTFRPARNITIAGEVNEPGIFPNGPNLTLKDLLFLAGGFTDKAYLGNIELVINTEGRESDMRPGANGQFSTDPMEAQIVRRVGVDSTWRQDPALDTILVARYDEVRVGSRFDYNYVKTIEVEGAVVNPGRYAKSKGLTLRDAIYLAGGPSDNEGVREVELYRIFDIEDRGNFNTRPDTNEIVRLRIPDNWAESAETNVELDGFYRVVLRSYKSFFQPGYVQVKGMVNNPGTFEARPNMTLLDLLFMAEGLKLEADYNRIELSRVVEIEDEKGVLRPIPVAVRTVSTQQDWQNDLSLDSVQVNLFDQVIVRKDPRFIEQENVFVYGEVAVPGEYVKLNIEETLSQVVNRAGGVTELAFPKGSYLLRRDIGKIALRFDKALRNPGSKYDIPLQDGDTLIIPPRLDVVTVVGNVMGPGTRVMFEKDKKSTKHYVNLAGGFGRRTKKNYVTVTYVDGRMKRAKSFLFFRNYPEIEQGAIVYVPRKPEKKKKDGPRQKVDWTAVFGAGTAILTFYLLLDRVLNSNP